MTDDVALRPVVGADEYPRLVEVWRTAVEATHDFLAEEHRTAIEQRLASVYFPEVHLVVADQGGIPAGFAGASAGRLEMLFVAADHRGRGIGSALLQHVIAAHAVTAVDVNEQNEQAVGFYERAGFKVTGRSPVDGEGLPYPLLHMTLRGRLGDGDSRLLHRRR